MNKTVQDVGEPTLKKKKSKRFFNPFPGLRPFGIDESHLFFGREGQSDDVLVKIATHKFVGIIGPSGSGKSSFIYCGIIPKLYGGFLAEKVSEWKVIVSRVGVDPLDNLTSALLKIDDNYNQSSEEEKRIQKIITSTLLQTQSNGLVERIAQYSSHPKDTNYFIVIDQFEELFRYKQIDPAGGTNDKALAFVNLLTEAVADKKDNIFIALAMRSDFIGDCAQYPELTRLINLSNYLIPQMTRDQKRMAILGPVAVGGAEMSPKLVQKLLNELGDNQDQLPVLAHSLMRTWDNWEENKDFSDEPIDIKNYEAIGKMEEALSLHADEAYNELNENQKKICETLFKSLIGRGSNNADIRRPTRLDEISLIAEAGTEEVKAVIEKFRSHGRALLTPPFPTKLDENSVIDFSHESIMRIWVRLKNWVEEENESIQMYLRLAQAAEMYQVGKAGLWRPPDLQLATNWREKEKPTLVWAQRYHPAFERTIAFLEHSTDKFETEQLSKEMQAKRALKRSQLTAVILGAAMIISLLFLIYAIFQQINAEVQANLANENAKKEREQRTIAQQNEKKAIKNEIYAQAQRRLAIQNAELARIQTEEAKKQTSIAVTQKLIAEREKNEADIQRNNAKTQEGIAKESLKEVTKQKGIAEERRLEADRLRMLSIARSMAVKSIRINDDTTKKTLVAQQAYNFNNQYGGNPNDPDIYDGLYYATKSLSGKDDYNALVGHDDAVIAVVPTHGGKNIFSAGHDGKILKWDMKNFQNPVLLTKNSFINRGLSISNDNKYLAVVGETPSIQLFDLNGSGLRPKIIKVPTKEVWFVGFTSDSKEMVYGDSTSIQIWDFNKSRELAKFTSKNLCMAINPKKNQIIVGNKQGQLILIDLVTGEQTIFYEKKNTPIYSVTFNNNGKYLAFGDYSGVVRVYDMEKKKSIAILTGHTALVDNIRFNNDDSQMATSSFDKRVFIWNTARYYDQPIALVDHKDWMFSVGFSPDGKNLLTGGRLSEFRIWPTQVKYMADLLCNKNKRNLKKQEWEQFVGSDILYQKTCAHLPEEK